MQSKIVQLSDKVKSQVINMPKLMVEKMKARHILALMIILIFSKNAFSSVELEKTNLVSAKSCSDLICVRHNIDLIDSDIVRLIGLRLTYVKQAGKFKKGKKTIHDQARENQIILKVTQLAEKEGFQGSIVAEVYKTLLTQTNIYEQKSQIDP